MTAVNGREFYFEAVTLISIVGLTAENTIFIVRPCHPALILSRILLSRP